MRTWAGALGSSAGQRAASISLWPAGTWTQAGVHGSWPSPCLAQPDKAGEDAQPGPSGKGRTGAALTTVPASPGLGFGLKPCLWKEAGFAEGPTAPTREHDSESTIRSLRGRPFSPASPLSLEPDSFPSEVLSSSSPAAVSRLSFKPGSSGRETQTGQVHPTRASRRPLLPPASPGSGTPHSRQTMHSFLQQQMGAVQGAYQVQPRKDTTATASANTCPKCQAVPRCRCRGPVFTRRLNRTQGEGSALPAPPLLDH